MREDYNDQPTCVDCSSVCVLVRLYRGTLTYRWKTTQKDYLA